MNHPNPRFFKTEPRHFLLLNFLPKSVISVPICLIASVFERRFHIRRVLVQLLGQFAGPRAHMVPPRRIKNRLGPSKSRRAGLITPQGGPKTVSGIDGDF